LWSVANVRIGATCADAGASARADAGAGAMKAMPPLDIVAAVMNEIANGDFLFFDSNHLPTLSEPYSSRARFCSFGILLYKFTTHGWS